MRFFAGKGLYKAVFVASLTALAALTACAAPAAPNSSRMSSSETAPTVLFAQAAPTDDLDKFMADKGLILQIGAQVGQASQKAARAVSDKAGELVVTAMGFLGVPYKRGGNNFESGFDCSGFVKAMYEQTVGLVLPRQADQQAAATLQIDKAELQPGDLVFFNTLKKAFSHVGIYVGDGKFIHSPRAGSAVRVENMDKAYWNQRFDGARRVDAAWPVDAAPTR